MSDAHHITASHPEGLGEQRALRLSLECAGILTGDVDYLNTHATSTQMGDAGELAAVAKVFADNGSLAFSSTKSSTGHTFGAAGAIEPIFRRSAPGYLPPPCSPGKVNPDQPGSV